ncbi:hypothetical protein [Jatrophihabitans sp.]|uniref:hypothetical protein n=1 Tax=Jatrophihabitans sp. TaxID=1932789 RepID=UPI0030C6D395|nr:fatty acid desaturase [Jatrophihabitans sp.]
MPSSLASTSQSRSPERYRRHPFSSAIREQIRQLNDLDNWHALVGYGRDIAVIITAYWLCLGLSWWFYPVALLLIASRQRAFSNLVHESAHGVLPSAIAALIRELAESATHPSGPTPATLPMRR